jgi:hypothetical protein
MSSDESRVGNDHTSGTTSMAGRIPVDLAWLDRQRALRGWVLKRSLAEAIGVRPETVSDMYRDAATGPETWEKLIAALKANPPDEIAIRLLGDSAEGAA